MKIKSYEYILFNNFNKRTVTYCKLFCLFFLENIIYSNRIFDAEQRILKGLQRNRLSRRRMIWLLSPPFPTLSRQEAQPETQRKTEKERPLAYERGGG